LVLLAASWKFIAIAAVAVGGFFARFFRKIKKAGKIVEVPPIQNKTPIDK
jgi:uncharacterized membrane protein